MSLDDVVDPLPGSSTAEPPPSMSATELAALIGVSPSTVYAMAARREVPHHRVGSRVVFSRTDIEAWWAAYAVPVRPSDAAERMGLVGSRARYPRRRRPRARSRTA